MSCIVKSYLFSSFTDMVRRPMKIGSADEVCSHLNQVLTASSVNDSACSEHSYDLTGYFQYIVFKVQGDKASRIFFFSPYLQRFRTEWRWRDSNS